jgi:hypothetical protein
MPARVSRRPLLVSTCLSLFLSAASVSGEIEVEILNLPKQVYSTEPVYVLYLLRNTGSEPELLPAEGHGDRGVELYWSRDGKWKRINTVVATYVWPHAIRSMWLAPGESWLFYQDVGYSLSGKGGEIQLQAVLMSSGRCGGKIWLGRHDFDLSSRYIETIHRGVLSERSYRCWKGEVRSEPKGLRIAHPRSAADRAAEAELRRTRRILENRETGDWSVQRHWDIPEKYPQSHIAYGFLARAGGNWTEKLNAIELQPDNPLNPWVWGALAAEAIDAHSSCASKPGPPVTLAQAARNLPGGVRGYLHQYNWYLEHRYCPLAKRGEDR